MAPETPALPQIVIAGEASRDDVIAALRDEGLREGVHFVIADRVTAGLPPPILDLEWPECAALRAPAALPPPELGPRNRHERRKEAAEQRRRTTDAHMRKRAGLLNSRRS